MSGRRKLVFILILMKRQINLFVFFQAYVHVKDKSMKENGNIKENTTQYIELPL
jgi:hypothetical protein